MAQARRSHSSDSSELSELAAALRQLDLARNRLHQALGNLARPRSRSPSPVPPISAPSRRRASPSPERPPLSCPLLICVSVTEFKSDSQTQVNKTLAWL